MRILALRGRNLASLAGEFEIDFEAAPLAGTGLFAITGPTGAGKSTLLDALCLALYDRLPRLEQASKTEVGGESERLSGTDVRLILRHGTANGFAEVDFLGHDGRRYRARWEVRRARNRVGERLQAQAMSLTDLADNSQLGHTKTEVLKEIRDRVGLDFDQFRRSVLLAQNEFDAFLRARPAERAELLELMTGTAIYGALSVAAFERGRREKAILDTLDDELRRVNVLDDESRAVIEADSAAAEAERLALETEIEHLTAEAQWHRTARVLVEQVTAAESGIAEAKTALADAEPERVRLAEIRRALTARPQVAEADRLTAEAARLEAEETTAQQEAKARQATCTQAQEARDTARLAADQADAAFKAAGPLLDRAAALDTRLAEGRTRLEQARIAQTEAEAEAGRTAALRAEAEQTHKASLEKITRLEQWLEANQARKPLVEQLDRWLDAIAAHGTAAAQARDAANSDRQAAAALEAIASETGQIDAAEATQRPQLAELDEEIATLDSTLATLDPAALEQQREILDAQEAALARLLDTAAQAAAITARAAEIAARRTAATARRDQTDQETAAVETRQTIVAASLSEAKAALVLAEAAEGEQALVLRQTLVADEPCPVCGSRQHPLEAIASALTGLLASHRQRVVQIEAERDDLLRRGGEAAASRRAAAEALTQAERDETTLARDRATVTARWSTDAAACPLPLSPDPFAVTDLAQLETTRQQTQAERGSIGERLRTYRQAELDRRTRSETRDRLRRDVEQRAATRTGLAARHATATAERSRASAEAGRARADQARLAASLAVPLAVLPDAERRLDGDPADLIAACRKLAETWGKTTQTLEEERGHERRLAAQADSARSAGDNARHNAARAAERTREEQAALDLLAGERAAVFEGRATADIRDEFEAARKAAVARHQAAQDSWAAADRDRAIALERVRALGVSRTQTADALAAALAAREAKLAEIGLDLAAVRAAMELGEAWAESEERRQAALLQAVASAEAVWGERLRLRREHEASGHPEHSAEALDLLLPERAAARDALRERLSGLRQRLADDDRNRDAAQGTRERIATQRQSFDLWKGIADLIGAADGKKFRLFAQGLTLDRLLGLANAHLAELTPRYLLQRAPGGDLDLQVIDRDMADEIRGVANLSGGERFLVSLALALGLASMTGRRTLAESLFIDEGFGALDAASLDLALSALESLHASGRKVGVISHVQPMIDRIGIQVRVTKQGGGRSLIETRSS